MRFARREPPTVMRRVRNILWPEMGLRRTFKFYGHKLHRLPESADAIAAGFGWGLAVSMTPLLGTHMILAALFARLTRASVVAALIATFAINPWTGPPIWLATYYLGRIMAGDPIDGHLPRFIAMFRGMTQAALQLDSGLFIEKVWPVFGPMLLGSLPLSALAGFTAFAVLRPVLVRLRSHRVIPA